MDTGFILSRGHVRDNGIVNWLEGPLGKDLSDVPGLGPASIDALGKVHISTSFQLLGYYLMLREKNMNTQQHCDAFYRWLRDEAKLPEKSNRHTVVRSIAEKANLLFPGIFNDKEVATE